MPNEIPDVDWKGAGAMVAGAIAVMGLIRRVAGPWGARQVIEVLEPAFKKIDDQLAAIRTEQTAAREARTDIVERLAHVEGIVERRQRPR